MNSLVLSWDADNAGRHIGQSILDNDAESLAHYSKAIKDGNAMIVEWAQSHGGKVVSDGGDQGVVIFDESSDIQSIMSELEHVRAEYQQIVGNSVTFGIGSNLSESGKALIAGKLMGKDMTVPYDDHVEQVLVAAHDHAKEGHATADEEKQDEHYINHLMGDEDDDMQGYGHQYDLQTEDLDQDPSAEGISGESATEIDGKPNDAQSQIADAIKEPGIDDEEMPSEDGYDLGESSNQDEYQPELEQIHEAPGEQEDEMPMPMQDDGMQTEIQEMSDEMPMQEESAPKVEGEDQPDFQEEKPINIDLPEKAKKDEEMGDLESEAMMEMATEDSQFDAIKDKVAQVLQSFKSKKETLEQLKQADPQAYQVMIEMLKAMIEMAHLMAPTSPQDDQPAPAMQDQAAMEGEQTSLPKQ